MSKVEEPLSLVDFIKAEKRKKCSICALSPEVLEQLHDESNAKIRLRQRLDWLNVHHKVGATMDDLKRHINERHYDG